MVKDIDFEAMLTKLFFIIERYCSERANFVPHQVHRTLPIYGLYSLSVMTIA